MIIYATFCLFLVLGLLVILSPVIKDHELDLKHRLMFAGIVGVFFLVGFLALYYLVGSPEIVPMMAERNQKMVELRKSIVEYSDKVKADPKDLGAWVGLGQSFMETGQYKGASDAFKEAVVLSKGNPLITLAYAGALISGAGGKVTDDAKQSLEMVLVQQPQNPEARYLLAVRMLQDGKNEDAMKAMRELYYSLPDDSPLKIMIDKQIGRAN